MNDKTEDKEISQRMAQAFDEGDDDFFTGRNALGKGRETPYAGEVQTPCPSCNSTNCGYEPPGSYARCGDCGYRFPCNLPTS